MHQCEKYKEVGLFRGNREARLSLCSRGVNDLFELLLSDLPEIHEEDDEDEFHPITR